MYGTRTGTETGQEDAVAFRAPTALQANRNMVIDRVRRDRHIGEVHP